MVSHGDEKGGEEEEEKKILSYFLFTVNSPPSNISRILKFHYVYRNIDLNWMEGN